MSLKDLVNTAQGANTAANSSTPNYSPTPAANNSSLGGLLKTSTVATPSTTDNEFPAATPTVTPMAAPAPKQSIVSKIANSIGNFFDTPEDKVAKPVDNLASTVQGQSEMIDALTPVLAQKQKALDPTDQASVDDFNATVDHYNTLVTDLKKNTALLNSPEHKAANITADTKYQQDLAAASTVGKNLPSAIAENLPFGVGSVVKQIHDMESGNPQALLDETGGNVAKSIVPGAASFAQSTVKGLASVPLTVAGAAAGATENDSNKQYIAFNIPGLGRVTNLQARIVDDYVQNGKPSATDLVSEASGELLNGLWLYSMIKAPFVSSTTKVADITPEQSAGLGNNGNALGETPAGATPRSFRLYQKPTIQTPVFTELNPEMVDAMKGQGVDLSKYDPAKPTVFRFQMQPNGQITGEVLQVKPSFAARVGDLFKSDPAAVPSEAFESEPLYSKTITDRAVAKAAESPTVAPAGSVAPEAASTAHDMNLAAESAVAYNSSPSEVRDNLAQANGMLNTATGTGRDQVIARVNAHQDAQNDFVKANSETALEVPGTKNTPAAKIEVVPYEDGKFTVAVSGSLPNASFGSPHDPATVYDTREEAVEAGKAQLSSWLDSAEKNTTPAGAKIAAKTRVALAAPTEVSQETSTEKPLNTNAKTKTTVVANPNTQVKIITELGGKPKKVTPTAYGEIAGHKVFSAPSPTGGSVVYDLRTGLMVDSSKYKVGARAIGDVKGRMIEKAGTEVKVKKAFDNAHKMPDRKQINPTADEKPKAKTADRSNESGFVAPGQVAADIKATAAKLKAHFEETNKAVKFAGNLDDTLYKTQKNAQADVIDKLKLAKEVKGLLTPAEWENIYHYREALAAGVELPTLSPREAAANEQIIKPIIEQNTLMKKLLKGQGIQLAEGAESEDPDTYNPRIVKNKGNALDRAIASKDDLMESMGGGKKNVLKQSAPALKNRVMKAITNVKTGERTVVAIKGNRVTSFPGGQPKDLGALKKPKVAPQSEYTDQNVRDALEKVARDLGIKHETVMQGKKDSALGRKAAGVSMTGRNTVKTRVGVPERVLLHEIGHQIDDRYKLSDMFPDTPLYKNQMRALADLRHENSPTLPSFKTYVRKTSEKMAVMFEAYLHAPARFEEVAPQLYDAFKKFLGRHPELAPILNIKPSLVLGKNVYTDNQVPGTFTDKMGIKYNVGEATTKEIEAGTKVRYYKNPFVNAMLTNNDLTQAYRATQTIEAIKNSPEFANTFLKSGEGVPPKDWKMVNLDQLRGYYAEPHTANVLNAFAQDLKNDDPIKVLSAINNFVTSTVFMSPVGHMINVGTSAAINRGLTSWINPLAYPRLVRTSVQAIRDVVKQNPEYMEALRAGAPFMSNAGNAKEFKDELLDLMGEKPDAQKQAFDTGKKYLGYINPLVWTHKLTWPGNDMILLQQILETKEKTGMSFENAIKNVTQVLPNYRMTGRFGTAARRLGRPVTGNLAAFLTYRLNTLQSFYKTGRSLITGKEDGQEAGSGPTTKARLKALDKIAMGLFLGLIAIPLVNEAIKKKTKNPYAHVHEPAQLAIIDNLNKLISGDIDAGAWAQTILTPAIGTAELAQQFLNLDFFTGDKIRVPGTSAKEQATASAEHAATAITPLDQADRLENGKLTPAELAESLVGIDNPKTGPGAIKANSLIYDLKPDELNTVKGLIAAGKNDEAYAAIENFNDELQKAYEQTYTDAGEPVDEKNVAIFLQQNGMRVPTGKAVNDYTAKQNAKVK